jgi:hypothetical protein
MKRYKKQGERYQFNSGFANNLGQLLLAPPLGEKRILMILL